MVLSLHLGAHKTASTLLQNHMHLHRDQLLANGVSWLGMQRIRTPLTSRLGTLSANTQDSSALLQHLEEQVPELFAPTTQIKSAIISDENLIGGCRLAFDETGLYPRLKQKLTLLAAVLPAPPRRIFLSIRQIDTFVVSAYCEALLHANKFFPFRSYYATKLMPNLLWRAVIERIHSIFPSAEIIVWRYEDLQSIALEVTAMMLGPDPAGAIPPISSSATTRASLSAMAIAILQAISPKLLSGKDYRKTVRALQKLFPKGPDYPGLKPRLLQHHDYVAAYAQDIDHIGSLRYVTLIPRASAKSVPDSGSPPAVTGRKLISQKNLPQSIAQQLTSGFKLIQTRAELANDFGLSVRQWNAALDAPKVERYVRSFSPDILSNPDLLYTMLNYGLANNFEGTLPECRDAESSGLADLISESLKSFTPSTSWRRQLVEAASQHIELSDDELIKRLKSNITIEHAFLETQHPEQSWAYTKINHGFWEKWFSVTAPRFRHYAETGRFGRYPYDLVERRLVSSGIDSLFTSMLRRMGSCSNGDFTGTRSPVRISISFGNGVHRHDRLVKRPFNHFKRAAYAGALSLLKVAVTPSVARFGDGSEAKSLLLSAESQQRFLKGLSDCQEFTPLFIVPSHLKNIFSPALAIYPTQHLLPSEFVHETWRVGAAMLLGRIQQEALTNHKLLIFAQGGMVSSVLGMILNDLGLLSDTNPMGIMKYFDLGRALDSADPRVGSTQNWIKHRRGAASTCATPLFALSGPSEPKHDS